MSSQCFNVSGISLIWQSKLSSPRAADNGIPWMFPDGESVRRMQIGMRINPDDTQ
jgi:hypothetical protein